MVSRVSPAFLCLERKNRANWFPARMDAESQTDHGLCGLSVFKAPQLRRVASEDFLAILRGEERNLLSHEVQFIRQ